jgi:hypothetical protein
MAAGGEKYDSSWSGRVFIAQGAEMILLVSSPSPRFASAEINLIIAG